MPTGSQGLEFRPMSIPDLIRAAAAQPAGACRASRHVAIVPAAGVGARLGAALPKQYLPLAGRTVIEWSVAELLAADWIDEVVVVVAPADAIARRTFGTVERLRNRIDKRAQTVQAAAMLHHQHHREISAQARHRRLAEIAAGLKQRGGKLGNNAGTVFTD